jgi:hypothetical protein
MSTISPENILLSIIAAENEWPVLVGEDWPKIKWKYRDHRNQLQSATGPKQMRAAADLVQLLAPYPAASERLNNGIVAQTEAGAIVMQLAALAKQLGVDPIVCAKIGNAAKPTSPQRYIWQSSPTKATSIKLKNVLLSFEFGMFSEFLAGLITTSIKDVIGEANGVLRAAGVLLMIASLYKTLSIKLDEREATVFFGFTQIGREAKEDNILNRTNRVRETVSLKVLNKQELGNALHKLAAIKSVERVKNSPNLWRIIENHKAKYSF